MILTIIHKDTGNEELFIDNKVQIVCEYKKDSQILETIKKIQIKIQQEQLGNNKQYEDILDNLKEQNVNIQVTLDVIDSFNTPIQRLRIQEDDFIETQSQEDQDLELFNFVQSEDDELEEDFNDEI